jgi:transposase
MIANSKDKNDRNDAFWLAYLTFEGRLPEAHVPETIYRELRVASRERVHAVQTRSDAMRRLRAHMRQLGERLPTASFDTKSGRAFAAQLARRIRGARGLALRTALDEIEHFDAVVERWEGELTRLCRKLPSVEVLRREIPGVGKILAATILAETGNIGRFSTPKALGRFTGMTPSERSTGGVQIHGGITKEGSRHLRWALVQAVVHCMRCKRGPGLAIGDWTRARGRRLGRAKARVAAARKLAESIWRLFHWGERFDVTKPFGGRALETPALRRQVGLE